MPQDAHIHLSVFAILIFSQFIFTLANRSEKDLQSLKSSKREGKGILNFC